MEKAGVVNRAYDYLWKALPSLAYLHFFFSVIYTMFGFGDGDVMFVWLLGRDVLC